MGIIIITSDIKLVPKPIHMYSARQKDESTRIYLVIIYYIPQKCVQIMLLLW
jgi:hypothetical protein